MPMSLTPMQADCVRAFAELQEVAGCAPTFAELAGVLGCGASDVARLMDGLEERGWITRLPHRARGVRLLHPPPPAEHGEEHEPELEITSAGRRYLEAGEVERTSAAAPRDPAPGA